MERGQGRLRRKGITSLSIITTPVIILAGIIFILVLQQSVPSLFGQVASGSSFFIPFIPAIDLLGFLPESVPAIPFTLGNLVDLIIDIFIALTIGIIPYRWHKSARELGIPFMDFQLYNRLEFAESPIDPSISGSSSARGSARKPHKDAQYSGIHRRDVLLEENLRSGTGPFLGMNPRGMVRISCITRRQAHHFLAWRMVLKVRKIPVDVVLAPVFSCLSIPSFYPSSRVRLHGARDGSSLFLSKSRVLDIESSNHITKGWR
jgi:hypothetical protein